jgi:hypothetical protein
MRIALEGPINACADTECIPWRNKVIETLGDIACFHNPMDFDCRGKEREMELALIEYDTTGLTQSDIVLVMAEKPGWGTAMAVQMAHDMHKHVVCVCSSDKPSPWLRNRTTVMCKTLDEAISHIRSLPNYVQVQ